MDTSITHSDWQNGYYVVEMTFFSAAQTWCAFCCACVMLHINVRNDDVVADKKSNKYVVVTNNKMLLAAVNRS